MGHRLRRLLRRGHTPGIGPSLQALFDQHGLAAYEKQLRFNDWSATAAEQSLWSLDEQASLLRIGSVDLTAHLIGVVSETGSSWTWAWAMPSIPARFGAKARQLREYGVDHRIDLFTEPRVNLGRGVDPVALALVAAGIVATDAVVTLPREDDSAFVLVNVPELPMIPDIDSEVRLVEVVGSALSDLSLPITRSMIESFARQIGASVSASATTLELESASLRFDKAGRIVGVERVIEGRGADGPRAGAVVRDGGVLVDDWKDGDLEIQVGWRDQRGMSPTDVFRAYLAERHSWERDAARAAMRVRGPDDPGWAATEAELAQIHSKYSTPRDLHDRDTSTGSSPGRDPALTRMIDVRSPSPDRVILVTAEEDPLGLLPPQRFDVIAIRTDGHWRLDDRILVSSGGRRIRGLL